MMARWLDSTIVLFCLYHSGQPGCLDGFQLSFYLCENTHCIYVHVVAIIFPVMVYSVTHSTSIIQDRTVLMRNSFLVVVNSHDIIVNLYPIHVHAYDSWTLSPFELSTFIGCTMKLGRVPLLTCSVSYTHTHTHAH